MSLEQTTEQRSPRKPLRLWPGVIIVVLQLLIRFVVPRVNPEATGLAVLVGLGGGVAVMIWWLFFSRAAWLERIGAIVLMAAALFATRQVVHASISDGMMGMMLPVYAIPILSLALVGWAVITRHLGNGLRWITLVLAIVIACGTMTLLRTGGMSGSAASDLHWRWTMTPEERLLAQVGRGQGPASKTRSGTEKQAALASGAAATNTPAEWPGFRGPERDGLVHGTRVATDWSRLAPTELWRHPIGPGWSSFAVHGNAIYTQEQRGEEELVSCYDLATGAPVWTHRDQARFWESNAGAGPRGTPTLHQGRVYSVGGTGILNALNAQDGSVVWSRNAAADTGRKIPHWGFASSPLIVGDLVVVATSGALSAYDIGTGNLRWVGPKEGGGYSSPHLVTIDGITQILLLNGNGAIGVAPGDGTTLWNHAWPGDGIVQPSLVEGGDVLIGSGSGLGGKVGVRRLKLTHSAAGWNAEERWTSIGLKPYFDDFVVHKGYAYGTDGSMLACVDLTDGKRQWKGGRYGPSQLVGLTDQDLLLVLSEQGELALVRAAPDQFVELARFPALKGKTWNHPVLVRDRLLVRNDQEMAAFRLPLAQ